MTTTYTLKVDIGENQMGWLVSGGYILCIARYMGTLAVPPTVNVIWLGSDVQVHSEFEWEETYQVYGSNPFHTGAHALAETNTQPIRFGETCELGPDRVLKPATGTPTPTGPFYFRNSSDEGISVGVNCLINSSYSPIFITPAIVPIGSLETLYPVKQVQAWFQQGVTTSTMIEKITSPTIAVPYQGVTTHTISYTGPEPGDATWNIIN